MNKILFLSGVAAGLFAANANAGELTPYVGAKFRYVNMSNEADLGKKIDIDDKVTGASLAVGTAIKVQGGAIRAEV